MAALDDGAGRLAAVGEWPGVPNSVVKVVQYICEPFLAAMASKGPSLGCKPDRDSNQAKGAEACEDGRQG